MRRYLCSHWALGPEQTAWIKRMGFSGLRFDIPWGAPKEYIRQAFDTMAEQHLEVLAIIGGWARWENGEMVAARNFAPPLPAIGIEGKRVARILLKSDMPVGRVSFEIGNEPDISDWDGPKQFAEFVRLGSAGIWEVIPTAKVVVGGVSNVNRKGGAKYLDAVCSAGVDARMILGIHPYRCDRMPPEAPKGWKSIWEVFAWLRSKRRPIWITEGGWHTAPQKRRSGPWGICSTKVQWDNQEIANFAVDEMRLWEEVAELYAWYSCNDGLDPNNPEDNFGIRYADFSPKPVAEAFEGMTRGMK